MNKEEGKYLPCLRAALEVKGYPADAIHLIMESRWAIHIIGDAWRNHVTLELSQSWFERRWLVGPMRCYWLWHPGMELADLPQDVTSRAQETMKRRKKSEPSVGVAPSTYGTLDSGYGQPSGYKPPSR